MQEEVTQKTIALVIKTAKLDANVLKAAMMKRYQLYETKASKLADKSQKNTGKGERK